MQARPHLRATGTYPTPHPFPTPTRPDAGVGRKGRATAMTSLRHKSQEGLTESAAPLTASMQRRRRGAWGERGCNEQVLHCVCFLRIFVRVLRICVCVLRICVCVLRICVSVLRICVSVLSICVCFQRICVHLAGRLENQDPGAGIKIQFWVG